MIPGEEKEWFCPNCGEEGDTSMINGERIVKCKSCKWAFKIVLYWNVGGGPIG